jgi:hypothetical protein
MPVGARPIRIQYERELREIARVDGVSPRVLPEGMQKQRREPKGSGRR